MKKNLSKQHWETVYSTKSPSEVSWTQDYPASSLNRIHSFPISKDAPIIDVGGGDSKLIDFLLAKGYSDLSVLDISAAALARARDRLGVLAEKVNWVESDVRSFSPERRYSVWHDRATFHFMTSKADITSYLKVARNSVTEYMSLATFSDEGPDTCSGLPIRKYTANELSLQLRSGFKKLKCETEEHNTPFNTTQKFTFCSFKRV